MLNFTELCTNVATMVQRSGDANYLTKIKTWVNMSQEYLFNSYDYYNELEAVHPFTSVDGQEAYHLPNILDKPLRIYDITNKKHLKILTEEEYFDGNIANIANATEGIPTFARIFGSLGTSIPIASVGTTLQVKSSSASDTSGIVIRVEGYIDSAKLIIDYENITVSTTTPTTFVAGTKTFYEVTKISKSADTTGYITVANSASTTVAILNSIDRVLRHKVLKLGLIPNASTYNYRVLYKKRINKLVNDYDYPFISADDFIILHSAGYALSQEKETVDRASILWNKSQEALRLLLRNQQSRLGPDFQHKMTSPFIQAHKW